MTSDSSIDGYIRALKEGCRCVEVISTSSMIKLPNIMMQMKMFKKLYEDILVNGNIECSLVFVLTVNKDECTKGDGHCPYIGQTTFVR